MNSLKEVLPAIIGLVVVALLILVFRAIRSAVRREQGKNKINHPKMWLEACRRIQKAVDDHSSGRLKMETIEDKDRPYGGKISVLWRFINERPEQVLSIRYLPEQPEDEIVITTYSSKGKAFDSFSQEEFADFLGGIEEQIFNYESPLSGGGDKSHKL